MNQNAPDEPEKELAAKQLQAIALLASGLTIATTAKKVGCDQSTIDRWKKLPEFMAALRHAESEMYDASLALLKHTAKAAITCLVRNMDVKVSPYVQVQAASKLLDYGMEVHKLDALEAEVRELQAIIKSRIAT